MMENRLDLLTREQIAWCDEHCDFDWFLKNDGKVYSKGDRIELKNKKTIVSFLVYFGDCESFDCSNCKSLKSLKGVSKNISGYFDSSSCSSLKSLEGAPETIRGLFDCSYCILLKTLEGASKNIGSDFNCNSCISLESLEGAPKSVGGNFDCSYCYSLKFIDELKNMKIGKKIKYHNCLELKKYDLILFDMNWFRKWQNSEYTVDEFMKEYDGFLQAKKYGI